MNQAMFIVPALAILIGLFLPFTIYVSPDRFRSFFDMPTDEAIYMMVVEQDGTVRAVVRGDHTAEKEAILRKAL